MKKHTPEHVFILVWALVLPVFVMSQISFWNSKVVYAADDTGDIQDSIASLEKKLKKEQAEKAKLEQNLGQIQNSVYATQRDINKTQSTIKSTTETILRKEEEIIQINQRIDLQMEVLKGIMQELFYAKKESLAGVIMSDGEFDDILGSSDHLVMLEEKLRTVANEIVEAKSKVEGEKTELAQMKEEHEDNLEEKKDQQQDLLAVKAEVASDVAEKEATISELNQKIAELRSALSGFLGKSYDTKDIDDAVKFASKATGIRKEFLQAELIVETGYGTFTGGCKYDDKKNLRMKPADKTEFLKLAKELEKAYGGNYLNKKLSCTPKRNGVFFGYGGAMGVAQFMPTTWIGYKSKISAKTGSNPADPWDLADGITGMAIKLANGGATSKKGEFGASMLYYCGSTNPSPASRKAACRGYAEKVQYFSKDPESHM